MKLRFQWSTLQVRGSQQHMESKQRRENQKFSCKMKKFSNQLILTCLSQVHCWWVASCQLCSNISQHCYSWGPWRSSEVRDVSQVTLMMMMMLTMMMMMMMILIQTMFRYGAPPTPAKFDFKSVVTASDSYVGDKLFSQDIRIERPYPGWVASSHCQGWESFSKVSVNDEQMSGVGYKKKGENMKILTWFPLYNFELN